MSQTFTKQIHLYNKGANVKLSQVLTPTVDTEWRIKSMRISTLFDSALDDGAYDPYLSVRMTDSDSTITASNYTPIAEVLFKQQLTENQTIWAPLSNNGVYDFIQDYATMSHLNIIPILNDKYDFPCLSIKEPITFIVSRVLDDFIEEELYTFNSSTETFIIKITLVIEEITV